MYLSRQCFYVFIFRSYILFYFIVLLHGIFSAFLQSREAKSSVFLALFISSAASFKVLALTSSRQQGLLQSEFSRSRILLPSLRSKLPYATKNTVFFLLLFRFLNSSFSPKRVKKIREKKYLQCHRHRAFLSSLPSFSPPSSVNHTPLILLLSRPKQEKKKK